MPTTQRLVHRPMVARAVDESNRTATPLELLFDLTFVVAVSRLADGFAHDIVDGHARSATGPFLMVFFAIWWAWMNFTWFASAYDCDDVPYRLAVFMQIGGVLVLAAGAARALEGDYTAIAMGYLIMRIGLLSLWLRAAVQHPAGRATALRYAAGVGSLEVLWLARLGLGEVTAVATFMALVVLELLVPVWAERAGPTSWHPHHIAERYSLFTIILLGEGVLAASSAAAAVIEKSGGLDLAIVSASGLVIVAALWWLCFAVADGEGLQARRHWSFLWGYGYYVPFAGLAALGAGLEVVVVAGTSHPGHLTTAVAVGAVAVPVGIVIVMVELLRVPLAGTDAWVPARVVGLLLALAAAVAAANRVGLTEGMFLLAMIAVGAVVADSVRPAASRTDGLSSGFPEADRAVSAVAQRLVRRVSAPAEHGPVARLPHDPVGPVNRDATCDPQP